MRPFASIILTTHEKPHLLARSLASLVNQTNPNFQIVVCADEGSTQTKNVATQYLRKTDVLLVLPHLRGPAETRNAGIEFSAARRIMFLDDDDSFDLNFMADLSSILDTNPINDLLYFNYSKI
jgi:glycosyltransferase involved in cell wall biosynthesis